MDLASRIQELRKNAGLSQEALAEMLGISRQALGKWESGASLPTLENLTQLAKIFHLSIDELITGQAAENPGEENPLLRAESVEALLQRIEQTQTKRTPVVLSAAVGILGALLLLLALFFAVRMHTLGQKYDALTERIDALASRPSDTTALYQQILNRLENEFTITEPEQFYFDWELLDCDLKKQTMTIALRATPRVFSPEDTLTFLLSPTSGTSDTLKEPVTVATAISEGQFSAQAEIPLCAELDVYIQYAMPDSPIQQELAAQLYDLSTQFVPQFEVDADKFGYTTWNYSTITFSGAPAVLLAPPLSAAAPKPVEIECSLYYQTEEIFSKRIDLHQEFTQSESNSNAEASAGYGTITYYPDVYEIEDKRFDYIEGAEIYWVFTLTDSDGNGYERRLSIATLS